MTFYIITMLIILEICAEKHIQKIPHAKLVTPDRTDNVTEPTPAEVEDSSFLPEPRIIGGEETDIAIYPFMVNVVKEKKHWCGGSYILPTWVLTAAHCLIHPRTSATMLPKSYTVKMGSTSLVDSTYEQERQAVILIPHEEFHLYNNSCDIGLIQIDTPFELNDKIKFAVIPFVFDTYEGQNVTVLGWGVTSARDANNEIYSNHLLKVTIPVVPEDVCRRIYVNPKYRNLFEDHRTICAGFLKGGKDACQKLDFHKEQAADLKRLTQRGDFPHLLVYGPSGSGKKTRIVCLLKELYGPGVERLRMEQLQFTTPSNKKLEIMTVSSNYHIEVNPSDVGIYDRIVVMDLIKNVAQTQQLDVNGQREFKVIILTDVDQLSKDAQHALRRTMEKYIANCRLILCCNSISQVTPAVRSRCLSIRVPAPTVEEIVFVLQATCKKEGLNVPVDFAKKVAVKSNRNLRRALLMLEACKVQQYPFTDGQQILDPDWLTFIREVAKKITHDQSVQKLAEVRGMMYELITHGIPSDIIFKTLLEELVKNCDMQLKAQVVEQAALYEHRMKQGSKEIFHFEAFIAKFMCMYKKFIEDAMGGF